MDLVSPLRPTSLLPLESHEIDPPSIPLPQSPVPGSPTEPVPSSLEFVDGPDLSCPKTAEEANLKRVEKELNDEKRRLDGGENALSELRDIVEDLQRQIVEVGFETNWRVGPLE